MLGAASSGHMAFRYDSAVVQRLLPACRFIIAG